MSNWFRSLVGGLKAMLRPAPAVQIEPLAEPSVEAPEVREPNSMFTSAQLAELRSRPVSLPEPEEWGIGKNHYAAYANIPRSVVAGSAPAPAVGSL